MKFVNVTSLIISNVGKIVYQILKETKIQEIKI